MKRLGLERCKRMRVGAKDANQWLQDGATPSSSAKPHARRKSQDPDELTSASPTSWTG
jgi:twinkle protein